MVDISLFAIVIASAVSLIVVGPSQASRKALRALREGDEVEPVQASDPGFAADAG